MFKRATEQFGSSSIIEGGGSQSFGMNKPELSVFNRDSKPTSLRWITKVLGECFEGWLGYETGERIESNTLEFCV